MNRSEASELDRLIRQQSALSPYIRPIGNGECVVVLHDNAFDFHLWSTDDWETHKGKWSTHLYTWEEVKPVETKRQRKKLQILWRGQTGIA